MCLFRQENNVQWRYPQLHLHCDIQPVALYQWRQREMRGGRYAGIGTSRRAMELTRFDLPQPLSPTIPYRQPWIKSSGLSVMRLVPAPCVIA
jgi:hypothetical protein